jgi:chitinase
VATKYPAFGCTGDLDTRKREVAAFLGNVAHETGDLVYINEINQSTYCDSASWFCSCAPGKQYYGRGPIQISWNYNYCYAGADLGYDLQYNPDLVATDATVTWATALWFWMTQQGAGDYSSCHYVMINDLGFGETIDIINGGLECDGGSSSSVQSRIDSYTDFCSDLGTTTGSNLDC